MEELNTSEEHQDEVVNTGTIKVVECILKEDKRNPVVLTQPADTSMEMMDVSLILEEVNDKVDSSSEILLDSSLEENQLPDHEDKDESNICKPPEVHLHDTISLSEEEQESSNRNKSIQHKAIPSITDQDRGIPMESNKSKSINISNVKKIILKPITPVTIDSQNKLPCSPASSNEADFSGENVLLIDESMTSQAEDMANVSQASSISVNAESSGTSEIISGTSTEILSKVPGAEEETAKNQDNVSTETKQQEAVTAPAKEKTMSTIEASIERCIANYTCEGSSDSENSAACPPKKQSSPAGLKPNGIGKFPPNYGFKIITNKIDLNISHKGVFTTVQKFKDNVPPAKRVKIKAKPIAESTQPSVIDLEKSPQEKSKADDTKTTPKLHKVTKNIKIAFRKSTEDKPDNVPSPAKERPAGLKVRDVESINATIKTVKAPICPIFPEDNQKSKFTDPHAQAIEKNLPDNEETNQISKKPAETEAESSLGGSNKTLGLRPIAPKCEPIASNDSQAVKVIRELIQLPSIPVYVPDVSDAKHFNGRLHLCHGCGDRFVLLKSLLEHQNRRSCVIKFQCLKCESSVLCFFNRCEFIRHLYNHNQSLTNTMLQYHITVERLPACNEGIFDVKICQECKVFLKVPMADHMQGADLKEKGVVDLTLKCQWCSLMLPTRCAYQAHRRMHFLQPPHVCPECGESSTDLPSFNDHINSVCFHTCKKSLFECIHCKAEMFDARKLERHIRNKHIRDVFKCNYCFVACFNLKDLHKHRQQNHEDKVKEEAEDNDESGLKYAFHLCDMCPNRLIRRVRLGQHLWDHTYANNDVKYVYECRKCKVNFSSKETLATHSQTCSASSSANTQGFATVVANGSDIAVQDQILIPSEVITVDAFSKPADLPNDLDSEVQNDLARTMPVTEEDDEMMVIDEIETPPPLLKAPPKTVSQAVSQTVSQTVPQTGSQTVPQTLKIPIKIAVKKKKANKKKSIKPYSVTVQTPEKNLSPVIAIPKETPDVMMLEQQADKSDSVMIRKPKENPSTIMSKKQKELPTTETHEAQKGRLDAVECETAKENKPDKEKEKEENFENDFFMDETFDGGDGMEVVLNCLECGANLTSELGSYCTSCEQKREATAESFQTASPTPLLKTEKKKTPATSTSKKPGSGNFSCRICNALISRTCDKAAIKRHFISKHKEIFIAALQTGMNARRNGQKSAGAPVTKSPQKKSASFAKISLKRKKKKFLGVVSESDTDDDSSPVSSPSKEIRKGKDKRKKSYSPSFPVLEQGMVALDENVSQESDNTRTCYKCSFQSKDEKDFVAHVTKHKINPKDLQCYTCGMCFVVRPSLEKHLLISHGIKNVDEYMVKHGYPAVEKEPDDVNKNQCKVCQMTFDTEALLEKHFRTHGSAFLLSKQFRRS